MEGIVKILRFNPLIDRVPYQQQFEYEYNEGMTVLDVLNYIYENIDSTLGYSYSCRNGHCGLCGIIVDGDPALACKKAAKPKMTVEPLRNLRVVKDLIIDRDEYERRLPQLRLFLERQSEAATEPEKIDMQEFVKFKIASRCIECFCCLSVCPVYKNSPHLFAGPTAYALEARHFFDPRDDLNRALLLKSEGLELCTECGLCSEVCMSKTDPAKLIRNMKDFIKNKGKN